MKPPLELGSHRLLICLGPGGVGKTTLSAALAVYAAADGRSVDAMTIDPAPRLLDALGFNAASIGPQTVNFNGVAGFGRPGLSAPLLRVHKLDPKSTFDALIRRHAPSEAACAAILGNRIYHNLSNALSGVADYMAMEKLLELYCDSACEFIVLDTPPAVEALDFLDAPRRLLDLLNSRAVSLLGAPRTLVRGGMKMVDVAARAVLSAFDRVTGLHLLGDIQTFVAGFEGMYTGFAERAERARDLLRAPETIIIVVTTPEIARIEQTRQFVETLAGAGLRVGAVVVNRTMPPVPDTAELARAKLPAALKRKLARNAHDFAALKRRETRALSELRSEIARGVEMLSTPDLGREPRSLADLIEIARGLEPVKF